MGPCAYGEEDFETGACKFLRFDGDIAVCEKIEAGNKKVIYSVGVGRGCKLRECEAKNGTEVFDVSWYLDEKVKIYKEQLDEYRAREHQALQAMRFDGYNT